MIPKILKMQPEYQAERLDPLHRHKELSNQLYAQWQKHSSEAAAENRAFLDFPTWIMKHHNKAHRHHKVLYLEQESRAFYNVNFRSNLGYVGDDLLNCHKTMKGKRTPFAVILSLDEEIYAIPLNYGSDVTEYRQHHSSVVAGEDVFFACELYASNGHIREISDRSGHYKPDLYSFVYGLDQLKRRGADLSDTRIVVNSWDIHTYREYNNAELFLSIYKAAFNSQFYMGEVANLAAGLACFVSSRSRQPVFYLDKEKNEVYKFFYYADNKVAFRSCTEEYVAALQKTVTIDKADSSTLDPVSTDEQPSIIASTASPYKFRRTIKFS